MTTDFAGRRAGSFMAMAKATGTHLDVWKRLLAQLSLTGADAGDRRTTPQPETLSGVVDRVEQHKQQRFVLMRLDAPAPGVALIGTYDASPLINVSVTLYFYGDDASAYATASEEKWRTWLNQSFASEELSAR